MGICAYCDEDKSLTREHIVPSFICEYQNKISNKNIGWNDKANKLIGGEQAIKDVCGNCNNVILGNLDKHAKYIFEKSGAFSQNNLASKVTLNYCYNKFLRWILKVSYNSARASNNNESIFHCYKGLILGTHDNDELLVLCGGIYKPFELNEGLSNPFLFRIAYPTELNDNFSVRLIVVGSFAFHLLIFEPDISKDMRESKVREYLKTFNGLKEIRKNSKKCTLTQLEQTFFASCEAQLLRQAKNPPRTLG